MGRFWPLELEESLEDTGKFIWQISKRLMISWRLKELFPLWITALGWNFWEPELKSLSAFFQGVGMQINQCQPHDWNCCSKPGFVHALILNKHFHTMKIFQRFLPSFCMGTKIKCESSCQTKLSSSVWLWLKAQGQWGELSRGADGKHRGDAEILTLPGVVAPLLSSTEAKYWIFGSYSTHCLLWWLFNVRWRAN